MAIDDDRAGKSVPAFADRGIKRDDAAKAVRNDDRLLGMVEQACMFADGMLLAAEKREAVSLAPVAIAHA